MTLVQRIKSNRFCIDSDIRPMLVMDGGNMEIIDIKENIPHYDLYIRYLGSCSGCASGSTGTFICIESVLDDVQSSQLIIYYLISPFFILISE